ncbi:MULTISPECIES: CstA-like transporter-associated (seleno)protein [Streptomyces]|nr:CstA-like transporter-associated (seleno)protein [Streptomyces sp. NEAU-HV9]
MRRPALSTLREAHHPEAEVPSRSAFERMRTDRQESDPRQEIRCG